MSDHARTAADIMATLLVPALKQAEHEGRLLYVWEREALA